ncbi:hypothetical protein CBL_00426 [Carabus blaptoides fortunei]
MDKRMVRGTLLSLEYLLSERELRLMSALVEGSLNLRWQDDPCPLFLSCHITSTVESTPDILKVDGCFLLLFFALVVGTFKCFIPLPGAQSYAIPLRVLPAFSSTP